MGKKLKKRFWSALVIFGLMGQVAWVVENMYLNVFIYKMFHASASDISLMVGVSAASATITTILIGALADYIGKRKLIICGGYILWGISILAFALVRMDILTPIAGSVAGAATLGVTLVILLDCAMTFFGSAANDAAFNAWMTDWGDENNRGKIEGINAMMPMVAILVVFGGFMAFDLEQSKSWTMIFLIIGVSVLLLGLLGLYLIEESPQVEKHCRKSEHADGENKIKSSYWGTVLYSFRPGVVAENKLLYAVIVAFAVFGISIQIFMPYLILYYEKSLGMDNYVLIMAPAILIAAVITAFYGKLFDMLGFKSSVKPTVYMLMLGYMLLYFGKNTGVVFAGSLLMMTGYLTGMAIFGAMIRNHIPEKKSGQFQGIRIIGQVLIPGIAGPAIGAAVLHDAVEITNNDGTTSFLPDERIFLAAFWAAVVLRIILQIIFRMMRKGHYTLVSESGERVLEGEESWKDYPRPQMKRENWINLNDGWKLNGCDIKVPFPPQSTLSGYGKKVGKYLSYSCQFKGPCKNNDMRTLIHFGAVDQVAEVWLNGRYLGKHEGGYLPFSYDITEKVKEDNALEVKVTDTLSRKYPYGKQRKSRGGMWYTPVSGIWQSVWMEQVPKNYIKNIRITPEENQVCIAVEMKAGLDAYPTEGQISVALHNGEYYEKKFAMQKILTGDANKKTKSGKSVLSGEVCIDFGEVITADGEKYVPQLWSPQHPYLYRANITVGEDVIETYFALRTVDIRSIDGVNRLCLNGEPIFMNGVLDQGYFCDGIYLPAEEKEYEKDILRMQELGINMLRKHIKVEPECFYYYCDTRGMLVMQDMVNNGGYSFLKDTALPTIGMVKRDDKKRRVRKSVKDTFEAHMAATQKHLYNHPCIVAYTIFNEGWGQFESDRIYEQAKATDPTRLYDATSGWFAQTKSDFDSYHVYFGDNKPVPQKRPMLLSEFGGASFMVPGHIFAKYNTYGYGNCKNSEELTKKIKARYEELILPIIKKGCCGCVYTQLSDVEDEVNGFYTYDRKVCKVNPVIMRELAENMQEEL